MGGFGAAGKSRTATSPGPAVMVEERRHIEGNVLRCQPRVEEEPIARLDLARGASHHASSETRDGASSSSIKTIEQDRIHVTKDESECSQDNLLRTENPRSHSTHPNIQPPLPRPLQRKRQPLARNFVPDAFFFIINIIFSRRSAPDDVCPVCPSSFVRCLLPPTAHACQAPPAGSGWSMASPSSPSGS